MTGEPRQHKRQWRDCKTPTGTRPVKKIISQFSKHDAAVDEVCPQVPRTLARSSSQRSFRRPLEQPQQGYAEGRQAVEDMTALTMGLDDPRTAQDC